MIKGIEGVIDELSDLAPSPLTPHGRDIVRTILLAFAAHVSRQTHPDPDPRPAPPASETLTFADLIRVNLSRVVRWHPKGLGDWSALEWAGAMAGEAGEACNAAKKLKRVETQLANHDARLFGQDLALPEQAEIHRKHIAKEVADTIIYGALLVSAVGEDLESAIVEVFNKKSEEYGFPERLRAEPPPAPLADLHRCTSCGYRWEGSAGAELCEPCSRAARDRKGETPPAPPATLNTQHWTPEYMASIQPKPGDNEFVAAAKESLRETAAGMPHLGDARDLAERLRSLEARYDVGGEMPKDLPVTLARAATCIETLIAAYEKAKGEAEREAASPPFHPLACQGCGHSRIAHGQHDHCTECLCRHFVTDPPEAPASPSSSLTGWQPIETAPKDGTRVMVWIGNAFRLLIGHWDEDCDDWADEDDFAPDPQPTHWMLLPLPPSSSPKEPQ